MIIATETIIMYRNQREQAFDEFWMDMAFPWMYTHWVGIVIFLTVIVFFCKLVNRHK